MKRKSLLAIFTAAVLLTGCSASEKPSTSGYATEPGAPPVSVYPDEPDDTPDVPATTPGTTPATTPATTPGTTPATTPATTPGTTPATTPGTTPATTPGTTPATTSEPVSGTESRPIDTEAEIDETEPAPAGAEAVYPQMVRYPNVDSLFFGEEYEKWYEGRAAQRSAVDGYADNLWHFYTDSTEQFLSGAEENKVYSPLNLYMALAMLAETTEGNSRQQILDLLSAEDIGSLREQAGLLWNANYCDDGAITSIMGNSVWLDNRLKYNQNVLGQLAESYYTSSYSGEPGSEQMDRALQDWLNKQTGGLLKDAVDKVHLDPDTVLALYSTVLFKAKWDSEFSPSRNDTRTFHSPDGDIEATFMNSGGSRTYYWGEDYGAVELSFASGCSMWLILPDEDKGIDDVLKSGEYMELIKSQSTQNSKHLIVNLSVPKFDVSSTIDLKEGLSELGITDVFSPDGDFSILDGDNSGIYVGRARHSARVKIDEEGCEAAAFTELALPGAAMPPDEEMDFVLDRPFMFVISGMDDQPLFTGTVYNP